MKAVKRVVANVNETELPISKNDYVKLVYLCVKFSAFTFDSNEYRQHRGLAMGSTRSVVMTSLYMEMLEEDSYKRIMGRGAKWFRYVDDVLVILPKNTNIDNKLRRLNDVNSDIQFAVEIEEENQIPFLDTLLHRRDDDVRFSVYRKPTNRHDFIHYFSAHNEKTKRGVVTGFLLRI